MALRKILVKFINLKTTRHNLKIRSLSTLNAPKDENSDKKQTHFGFETINEEEKTKKSET